jgi:hypothetical protein
LSLADVLASAAGFFELIRARSNENDEDYQTHISFTCKSQILECCRATDRTPGATGWGSKGHTPGISASPRHLASLHHNHSSITVTAALL